jgi:hypothetical protein
VRQFCVVVELVDGPRADGEQVGYLGDPKQPITPAPEDLQVGERGRRAAIQRRGVMRGAVIYGKGDVRFEEREAPRITQPTDAIARTSATCVCGSDLWSPR